jgi:hypothetical protein
MAVAVIMLFEEMAVQGKGKLYRKTSELLL